MSHNVNMPIQPSPSQAHTSARDQSRHSAGTANAETPVNSGPDRGAAVAVPAPRLLDLRAAGRYLGMSYWTIRDLVQAGTVPTVRIPCPRARDGRVIRRVLIDRRDLDALIERCREGAE